MPRGPVDTTEEGSGQPWHRGINPGRAKAVPTCHGTPQIDVLDEEVGSALTIADAKLKRKEVQEYTKFRSTSNYSWQDYTSEPDHYIIDT